MPFHPAFRQGSCPQLSADTFPPLFSSDARQGQVKLCLPSTHHHPLQASHVSLLGSNFEVSVNDANACQPLLRNIIQSDLT